jgi:hypothetical protein
VTPTKRSLVLSVLLSAVLVVPASAAEPQNPFVIDLDEPALDADESTFWTAACGFPVTAEISGHIIVHREKNGAITSLTVFHITERLTSANGSYFLVDVGPDIAFTRQGVPYVAVVGRSLTGSGVIGRVLVNEATGELEVSGKLVGDAVFGDFTKPICRALR